MDTSQLAATIVTWLSPYLAKAGEAMAKKAGEAALGQFKILFETVQNKFKSEGNKAAQEALQSLEKSPDDEGEQKAMAQVLDEALQADPDFATALFELVKKLSEDKPSVQFITEVYGEAKVDNIINIGHVDKLEIN